MKLSDLGLTEELSEQIKAAELSGFSVGRVTQEHRERYVVSDGETGYDAEITGNLRFTSVSRTGFPAVGDWVAMVTYDSDQAIIHRVLPRRSVLSRRAVGKFAEEQIIATNIDVALIVQAINNNFSMNRLERYLTISYESGIEPVLLLSKIDLSSENEICNALGALERRDRQVKYILFSNTTHEGLERVIGFLERGRTYCVIGSSGVGKSTLINNLLKRDVLKTGLVSKSTNKGKHITEHRELFVLENGSIIIDNPGMRELGTTEHSAGMNTTFQDIAELSAKCRFADCSHINESGCAVTEAVTQGQIDRDSYENYLKIRKEQERFQTTVAEKRRKDKVFGKILKNYFRDIGKNGE